MKSVILIVFLLITMTLEARADFNRCRWTVEGTNEEFAKDPATNQPPRLVSNKICGTADGGVSPTICEGMIYCEDGPRPPFTGVVACAAQDMGNGKFSCPSAGACAQDETVMVDYTKKIPSPRVGRPAGGGDSSGTGSSGNAEGVRQGGGR